jgi:hypothetical protein
MCGASRRTSGVRTSTSAAALKKPQTAAPSATRARKASEKDIGRECTAGPRGSRGRGRRAATARRAASVPPRGRPAHPRRGGTSARPWPISRWPRATASTLADNWVRHPPGPARRLRERGARVQTADIRSREDLDGLLAAGPRPGPPARRPGQRPLSDRDPDYTEETNLTGARRVPRRSRPRAAARRLRELPARLRPASRHGRRRPGHALRPAGGPRAPLEDLRRGLPAPVRRAPRVRPGPPAAGHRLRAEPVEHDAPESQTVIDTLPPPGRRGTAAARSTTAAARPSARSTSPTSRGSCSTRPAAPGSPRRTSPRTPVTVADVAALARGEEPGRRPAWTYASPFAYRRRVAEYLRR